MINDFSRRLDFSDIQLYAVSSKIGDPNTFLKTIDGLLAGGVDALQLRASDISDKDFLKLGKLVKERCQENGVLFIVNNRVDLATVLDADGVHLGQSDMSPTQAREILGHRKIIGVSAHSIPEALAGQRGGADYVSCGPIWATPTKPDYPAVGLKLIDFYKASIQIPFVAIGGIDLGNVSEVLKRGATKVAAVRALFDAADPKSAAEELKKKISEFVNAASPA